MCRYYILILVLIGSASSYSQNLVPNHDFSNINCGLVPNRQVLQNSYSNWFRPPHSITDSIYGNVSGIHAVDTCALPYFLNKFGYDTIFTVDSLRCVQYLTYNPYPLEGTGYLGIFPLDSFNHPQTVCYSRPPNCAFPWSPWSNFSLEYTGGRSFAEVMLSKSLIANEEYVIEFHALRGLPKGSPTVIQNLGAFVSADTFSHFDYKKLNIAPTIESNQLIYEEKNWVKIKGSFTAIGNEKFVTIGNFRKDPNTNLQYVPVDSNHCPGEPNVYFVDAVYLYLHTDTLFNVELPPDTTLCPGQTLQLHAWHDDGFKLEDTVKTFLWSNGSTDSSITVTQPGFYWVKVEYNHRFWQSDTIEVKRAVPPYTSGLNPLREGCQGDEVILRAQSDPNRQLLWSTGYVGQSITVKDSGYYWLSALSVCDTVIDSVLVNLIDCDTVKPLPPVYIPSAFTPNGDGLNDTWAIGNLPEENELVIFNRWGELIYRKVNYQNEWDGTNRDGSKLPLGVYIYQLTYTHNNGKTITDQGWVSVLDN